MAEVRKASCHCGAVELEIAFERGLENIRRCDCSLCRRSRAAAFSSTLLVPRDAFRWCRGEERVRSYALPAPRQYGTDFCGDCGSLVPSATPSSPSAMLPAGAIDTALPPLPAVHLYVGSNAPWYDIVDSWPQFAELPPRERFTEFFQ